MGEFDGDAETRGAAHADAVQADVGIERRTLLWLPVVVASGATHARGGDVQSATRTQSLAPLDRDGFEAAWRALAAEIQVLSADHDQAYAAALLAQVARLPLGLVPRLQDPVERNGIAGGPCWFVAPCICVEFRLKPGAELPLHNHPPQVVATVCLEGEAHYRHFEHDGDAPPCTQIDGKPFRVRETRAGVLRPGQATVLTRQRDGMHTFRGGAAGGSVVDFTLSLTDDIETFSYVELAPKPIDAERRTWEAKWLGKRR